MSARAGAGSPGRVRMKAVMSVEFQTVLQAPLDPALAPVARLLDALNCGAVLLERAGRIVHVNRRLCEMMHRTRDELVDVNVLTLYESADAQRFIRQALVDFDTARDDEFFLPLPDGARLPVISSARVLGGSHDPAILRNYSVVTLIDISRQKEAEQNLRDQYTAIAELSDTVLEQALALKSYSTTLEERVRERTAELRDAHMDAIYMLAIASEAKDDDTGRHVRRLERYAEALAAALGLDAAESHEIGYSAVLHDVGKIHIPDVILKKPGPLTDAERVTMQQHTVVGQRILSPGRFFTRASRIARSHHENWDGTGYPDRLAGESIPLEARIVHLADVYDALTNARVYKGAWSPQEAADLVRDASGSMFEPRIVRAFEALFHTGELDRIRIALETRK